MAKAYNARCLVLKKTKLRETDLIITMLSSKGEQVRAVANGVRKPGNRIGARLEPFALVDVLLHEGRSLDTVREVRTVNTHAPCREGLDRPACANVIVELLEKMGRDGASLEERVFLMSDAALTALEKAPEQHGPLIVAAHIFKCMAMQGFAPATRACAMCGKPLESPRAFDVAYGGAICADCEQRLGSTPTDRGLLIGWIDALLYSTFDELISIDNAPQAELLNYARQWVGEYLSMNIKSIIFLNGLL